MTEVMVTQLRWNRGRGKKHTFCDCGEPKSHVAENCHLCANIKKWKERRRK